MAQVEPWTVAPTGITHTISIKTANISVDNVPIKKGDVIGLFYDSVGYLACGGYAAWPSANIIAYGDNSGTPNGFTAGQTFQFKIWEKSENCIIDSGTIIQFQYVPGTYDDSIFFKPNGSSKLITLNGSKKQIYYAQNSYCLGDADPLPIKKGTISDVTYSSQMGLSLDPNTGKINIAASTPGTYTIYFHTSLCLKANSFMVKIKLNLDNMGVNIAKSGCTTKGQITIDESTIGCGNPPYQFRLKNILTGQNTTTASNNFPDLNDGTYELYVNDANGEEVKWNNSVNITKECKDLIIAPNSATGQASSYYIPYKGQARIYDRFGFLKKEMSIPADWDATDNTGTLLPMGEYIIICNENERIVVTVIK